MEGREEVPAEASLPTTSGLDPPGSSPAAEAHEGEQAAAAVSTSYGSAGASSPAVAEAAAEAAPPAAPAASLPPAEEISFKIAFGKHTSDVKRAWDSTVGELKVEIETTSRIPAAAAKLMLAGKLLKEDNATLRQAGLKSGSKLLLIGTSIEAKLPGAGEAAAASASAAGSSAEAWDAPIKVEEPICKQTQHAKVLAKGKPEDALAGIKGRQVPLAETTVMLPGMLNSQGSKVRLTFKPEIDQLWIGTATHTQKVALSSITKIQAWPVDGQEEYSIVSMQLGASAQSRLWLYFVPSQYVSGIKLRILGVMSLI